MEALVTYTKDGHKKKARRWLDGRLKFNPSSRDATLSSEDGEFVASGKIPADVEIADDGDEFVLEAPSMLVVIGTIVSGAGAAAPAPGANENAPQGVPSGPRRSFNRPASSSGLGRRAAVPPPDARPAAPRPAWQPQQRREEEPAQRPLPAFKPPGQQQQRSTADILRLLGGGSAPAAPPAPLQPQQPQAVAPPARQDVEPPAPKRSRMSLSRQAQQQPPPPPPPPPASFRPAALPQREAPSRAPAAARKPPGSGRWDQQRLRGAASVPVQHQPGAARAGPPPAYAAPPSVLSGPPPPGTIHFPGPEESARPQRQVVVPDAFPSAGAYQRSWRDSLGEEVTLCVGEAAKVFHAAAKQLPSGAAPDAVAAAMHRARVPYHAAAELFVWRNLTGKKGGQGFAGGRRRKRRGEEEEEEEEEGEPAKPDTLYVILKAGRAKNEDYGKGDVWIIGTDPLLRGGGGGRPGEDRARAHWVGLVRSLWFAPNQDGKFEVEFLSARPATLPRSTKIYALKGPNCHTELALLDLLGSPAVPSLPLLPALLGAVPLAFDPPAPPATAEPQPVALSEPSDRESPPFSDDAGSVPSEAPEAAPDTPAEAAEAVIRRFELNPEQAQVVRHVETWAHDHRAPGAAAAPPAPPICLCFGPFGCGKSTLLVAVLHLIMTLRDMELRERGAEGGEGGGPPPRARPHALTGARVLVSAHTNVAVDRVLLSLLDSGRTDFLRVGPLRRVDRRLLPHSLHASESKNAPSAAAELGEMLREGLAAGTLTPGEEETLRRELAAAEGGGAERARRRALKTVPVVGVTCCSALIPAMEGLSFDVVVLDESSQVVEPLALAPLLRARARFLVAAGDPRQLPPLVAAPALLPGARAATAGDDAGAGPQGLPRPLFVRLSALGASPHLLRRQYRCHPAISAIPNAHFYGGRLLDGCAPEQRPSLLAGLPNVVAVDVHGEERREGRSTANPREAAAVVGVVKRALAEGVDPRGVGVICFFRAQAGAVRRALQGAAAELQGAAEGAARRAADAEGRRVWAEKARRRPVIVETSSEEAAAAASSEGNGERVGGGEEAVAPKPVPANVAAAVQVATVDAFQGAEKDVIVLTTATTRAGAFAGDPARLNVALTRARHNLVVVGCAQALQNTAPAFAALLRAARGTPRGYRPNELPPRP